jgi:hypothetical protein
MATGFWELFVQRVTTSPHQHVSDELKRLAAEIAAQLASLDTGTAAGVLSGLTERIAQQYVEIQSVTHNAIEPVRGDTNPVNGSLESSLPEDPSDVGAPPGAPKPMPVPVEVLTAARRDFNEAEVVEAIREIRGGGGRQLEDFLPDLEKAASEPDIPPTA